MIVKCSHCHEMVSEETFGSHECDIPINGVKVIEVMYFRDDSYRNEKRVTGRGIDGVLYTFKVVPRKAIPIVMTTAEILQHKQNDEDLTEPKQHGVCFLHARLC